MADSHFYLPPEKQDRLTVVYSAGAGGLARAPDPGGMVGQGAYVDGPRMSFSGGAGILSTASDDARFLQMMLNGGKLGDARILSPKSVEFMTVDHLGGVAGPERERHRRPVRCGTGCRIRARLPSSGRPGRARRARLGRRVRVRWGLPLELLGRPAGGAGRRVPGAAHPRREPGRPRQVPGAGLPGDRHGQLTGDAPTGRPARLRGSACPVRRRESPRTPGRVPGRRARRARSSRPGRSRRAMP